MWGRSKNVKNYNQETDKYKILQAYGSEIWTEERLEQN